MQHAAHEIFRVERTLGCCGHVGRLALAAQAIGFAGADLGEIFGIEQFGLLTGHRADVEAQLLDEAGRVLSLS